ncbi:hypothetical protein [Nocardiopsis sp. YSL2]|uniref:hypothetical protein n=1 Tax=Nocardiopsis sp. YSL2 TaxID=2939492 RepID=UPI0026F433B5|nr:hypothetical protein [Nocardiopsis sp. YSL2]
MTGDLEPPAFYLECRADRIAVARVLLTRIDRQRVRETDPIARRRLDRRAARLSRYLRDHGA